MPALFCFIDDARFELDNFAAQAAVAFPGVEFVLAQTFAETVERIGQRIPLCFLLDIYGSDPQAPQPSILPQGELAGVLGPDVDHGQLYQGLEQGGSEAGNLYLRRLYGQVERWQRGFLLAAERLGQGRGYGLANLAEVRRRYPWAAALGYSRKALYADAVALSRAGCDGLLQKPQGADDAAIAQATRQSGPELWQACREATDRRSASWLAARLGEEGLAVPAALPALAALLEGRDRVTAAQALQGSWLPDWLKQSQVGVVLQALGQWLELTA